MDQQGRPPRRELPGDPAVLRQTGSMGDTAFYPFLSGRGNLHAAVCEAVNVPHDCGEGGVVNPGERRPLDERAENVAAVDHAGARDRGERCELGQQRHAGDAPICWNSCMALISSQCSANMPSSTRQMSMDRISTVLPLGGMPMRSPVCVPR